MKYLKQYWMYAVGGLVFLMVAAWAYKKFIASAAPVAPGTPKDTSLPNTTLPGSAAPTTPGAGPNGATGGTTTAPTTMSIWAQNVGKRLDAYDLPKEQTFLLKAAVKKPAIAAAFKSGNYDSLGVKDQLALNKILAKGDVKFPAAETPNPKGHKAHSHS